MLAAVGQGRVWGVSLEDGQTEGEARAWCVTSVSLLQQRRGRRRRRRRRRQGLREGGGEREEEKEGGQDKAVLALTDCSAFLKDTWAPPAERWDCACARVPPVQLLLPPRTHRPSARRCFAVSVEADKQQRQRRRRRPQWTQDQNPDEDLNEGENAGSSEPLLVPVVREVIQEEHGDEGSAPGWMHEVYRASSFGAWASRRLVAAVALHGAMVVATPVLALVFEEWVTTSATETGRGTKSEAETDTETGIRGRVGATLIVCAAQAPSSRDSVAPSTARDSCTVHEITLVLDSDAHVQSDEGEGSAAAARRSGCRLHGTGGLNVLHVTECVIHGDSVLAVRVRELHSDLERWCFLNVSDWMRRQHQCTQEGNDPRVARWWTPNTAGQTATAAAQPGLPYLKPAAGDYNVLLRAVCMVRYSGTPELHIDPCLPRTSRPHANHQPRHHRAQEHVAEAVLDAHDPLIVLALDTAEVVVYKGATPLERVPLGLRSISTISIIAGETCDGIVVLGDTHATQQQAAVIPLLDTYMHADFGGTDTTWARPDHDSDNGHGRPNAQDRSPRAVRPQACTTVTNVSHFFVDDFFNTGYDSVLFCSMPRANQRAYDHGKDEDAVAPAWWDAPQQRLHSILTHYCLLRNLDADTYVCPRAAAAALTSTPHRTIALGGRPRKANKVTARKKNKTKTAATPKQPDQGGGIGSSSSSSSSNSSATRVGAAVPPKHKRPRLDRTDTTGAALGGKNHGADEDPSVSEARSLYGGDMQQREHAAVSAKASVLDMLRTRIRAQGELIQHTVRTATQKAALLRNVQDTTVCIVRGNTHALAGNLIRAHGGMRARVAPLMSGLKSDTEPHMASSSSSSDPQLVPLSKARHRARSRARTRDRSAQQHPLRPDAFQHPDAALAAAAAGMDAAEPFSLKIERVRMVPSLPGLLSPATLSGCDSACVVLVLHIVLVNRSTDKLCHDTYVTAGGERPFSAHTVQPSAFPLAVATHRVSSTCAACPLLGPGQRSEVECVVRIPPGIFSESVHPLLAPSLQWLQSQAVRPSSPFALLSLTVHSDVSTVPHHSDPTSLGGGAAAISMRRAMVARSNVFPASAENRDLAAGDQTWWGRQSARAAAVRSSCAPRRLQSSVAGSLLICPGDICARLEGAHSDVAPADWITREAVRRLMFPVPVFNLQGPRVHDQQSGEMPLSTHTELGRFDTRELRFRIASSLRVKLRGPASLVHNLLQGDTEFALALASRLRVIGCHLHSRNNNSVMPREDETVVAERVRLAAAMQPWVCHARFGDQTSDRPPSLSTPNDAARSVDHDDDRKDVDSNDDDTTLVGSLSSVSLLQSKRMCGALARQLPPQLELQGIPDSVVLKDAAATVLRAVESELVTIGQQHAESTATTVMPHSVGGYGAVSTASSTATKDAKAAATRRRQLACRHMALQLKTDSAAIALLLYGRLTCLTADG